jgi:hypothetical protein
MVTGRLKSLAGSPLARVSVVGAQGKCVRGICQFKHSDVKRHVTISRNFLNRAPRFSSLRNARILFHGFRSLFRPLDSFDLLASL